MSDKDMFESSEAVPTTSALNRIMSRRADITLPPNLKTVQEKMFEIFRQFPEGITAAQLAELLDRQEEKNAASTNLSQFERWGLAWSERGPFGSRGKIYYPTGKLFDQADRAKRSRPGDIEHYKKKIEELLAWRKRAIAKYPDLAVSDEIAQARERLALIYRDTGDVVKSTLAISGALDDTEAMKIVSSMLVRKR